MHAKVFAWACCLQTNKTCDCFDRESKSMLPRVSPKNIGRIQLCWWPSLQEVPLRSGSRLKVDVHHVSTYTSPLVPPNNCCYPFHALLLGSRGPVLLDDAK